MSQEQVSIEPSHAYTITDSEMSLLLSILERRATTMLREKHTEQREHEFNRLKVLYDRLFREFFVYESEH